VGIIDDKVQSGFGMRWFYNNPTQPNRHPTLNAMIHVTSGKIIADEGLTDVPADYSIHHTGIGSAFVCFRSSV